MRQFKHANSSGHDDGNNRNSVTTHGVDILRAIGNPRVRLMLCPTLEAQVRGLASDSYRGQHRHCSLEAVQQLERPISRPSGHRPGWHAMRQAVSGATA